MEHSESIIVDSALTPEQAIAQNPERPAPEEILAAQRLLGVAYKGYDLRTHQGQIVVHEAVAADVIFFFEQAAVHGLMIAHAIPAADVRYQWDDGLMMSENNTSGFNYRTIAGRTGPDGQPKVSFHGLGLAFDVNPRTNPYEYIDDQSGQHVKLPPGAYYSPYANGALHAEHPLVTIMEERGWHWGGRWTLAADGVVDYQHFEKPLT